MIKAVPLAAVVAVQVVALAAGLVAALAAGPVVVLAAAATNSSLDRALRGSIFDYMSTIEQTPQRHCA